MEDAVDPWAELERAGPESARVGDVEIRHGSRVRLHPRSRRDAFDAALEGRIGVVESIEEELDGALHVVVVSEDDPGLDLGMARMPGHRFFFGLDELEPLVDTRILVAGIGNLFLGDDGFGCEVARLLARHELPAGCKVVDFGIRGLDLAYALHEGYDAVVMLDAAPRGEAPGTLSVIEPDPDADDEVTLDTHGMDPVHVLQLARELGGALPRTLVVACEPARIVDPDEEDLLADLSAPVRAALDGAVALVLELLSDLTSSVPKGGPAR